MKKVAIIDYGMGNLDSVARAIEECGGEPLVTSQEEDIQQSSHIILPGVGAFADGIKNIRDRGIDKVLERQVVRKGIPFLGICLGMQLLAVRGWEGGEAAGLGWISGEVKRLQPSYDGERIPHMGWNDVVVQKSSALFNDFAGQKDFYFVHSYRFICHDAINILAVTPYCGQFVSAVVRDNIYGVQFHPEKSQKAGFKLIQNFLML